MIGFANNLFDKQYFPALVNTAVKFKISNSAGMSVSNAQATRAIIPRDFRRYGGVRLALNF